MCRPSSRRRAYGFRQVLATLNGERLNAAAAALGIARGALALGVGYAAERTAFGRPVGAFQALQHKLVDGAIQLESARGLLNRAAHAAARAAGFAPTGSRQETDVPSAADALSAMAKIASADAAKHHSHRSLRTHSPRPGSGSWGRRVGTRYVDSS